MRPQSSATEVANRSNLLLLIQLRWIAVVGQVFTILFVHFRLGIGLPMQEMGSVLALLAAINIASFLRYQRSPAVSNRELFSQLLLDVTALSAQLYLSGGALNPFISLFLLQVIIGAVLLAGSYAWALVVSPPGASSRCRSSTGRSRSRMTASLPSQACTYRGCSSASCWLRFC